MSDAFREFIDETRDGCVEKASSHFGVAADQLEVRVVPEGLEVSGTGGRTLVLAAPKDAAARTASAPSPPRERERGRGDRDRDRDRGRDRGGRGGGRDREPRRRERNDRGDRRESAPRERERAPEPPAPAGPLEIEASDLSEVGEFVEEIVRSIARGGKLQIDESEEQDEILIRITGDGAQHLARQQAGLGAAISHLAHRAAQNLIGEDASAYVELGDRGANRASDPEDTELENLARERAEQVLASGEPVLLETMDSRSRFVVHSTIRDIDGVTSESVAEGRDKRIKILPD